MNSNNPDHSKKQVNWAFEREDTLPLAVLLLALIKPLNADDMQRIGEFKPGIVKYLKWFARGK